MRLLLRLLVAAGLAADAIVHFKVAPSLPGADGGGIGANALFYSQAVIAAIVAVLVLAWPRRWTYAIGFLVAASALGAVLLYYFVDVGKIGPLPAMYEPVWYAEKTISAAGEGVAAIAALAGFVLGWRPRTAAPVQPEPAMRYGVGSSREHARR
jgi:hypothetical protein